MTTPNYALGLFGAIGFICIWSGFVVFSRMGVGTALTPYDISALRFAVAGAATLPFVWMWWPRHLGWRRIAVLAATGPGTIYSLLMYRGLADAPAAYAGVFANGSLPIFSMILAAVLVKDMPGPRRILAVAVIVTGGGLVAFRGLQAGGENLALGLSMFVAASAIFSVYIYGVARWAVQPKEVLAVINIPNALLFLPVWFFALPSGLDEAARGDIVFQALFQGLGPGFLALILFTLAARNLGSTATAGFSAAVPAGAALLAIPVLGETPGPLEWAGVALVSLGLIILVFRRG